MNRLLLLAVVVVSMLWLGGCMAIDCEEYGPPAGVYVVPAHPHPVVELIPVPGPPPRPYPHHHYPRRWR